MLGKLVYVFHRVHAHLKVVIIFSPEEKYGSSSVELTYFTVAIFITLKANVYKASLLVQAKSILQPWSFFPVIFLRAEEGE